jgi:hypothetical protein
MFVRKGLALVTAGRVGLVCIVRLPMVWITALCELSQSRFTANSMVKRLFFVCTAGSSIQDFPYVTDNGRGMQGLVRRRAKLDTHFLYCYIGFRISRSCGDEETAISLKPEVVTIVNTSLALGVRVDRTSSSTRGMASTRASSKARAFSAFSLR